MTIPLAGFSESWSKCLHIPSSSAVLHPIYEIAFAIFREMSMVVQYAIVATSTAFHHWCYLPSAVPRQYLQVSSWNIGHPKVLEKCFTSIWHPFPKENYHDIGRAEGLRITHDISYHPANGLCLGMSLIFLAKYLMAKRGNDLAALLAAAKAFQLGGKESCVRIQAIYDALMGVQGNIRKEEKQFFCHLLQGGNALPQLCEKQELLASIKTFLSIKNRPETLRQFVFDDLESKGVEITPDLYALTLELDAAWNLGVHANGKTYDPVHHAIIKVLAEFLHLSGANALRFQGKIAVVGKQLTQLAVGQYLVQFPNHSIVLVQTNEQTMAVWDPGEGLALLDAEQQQEALSQVLNYYGQNGSAAIKVIAIELKNANIANDECEIKELYE